MKDRNEHAHNWQLTPPDRASLVGSYVCAVCGARKSVTTFLVPHVTNDFVAQELARWMECLQAAIVHQEQAIRQFRAHLPKAKSPCIVKTLKHLEQTLVVNRSTLRQFEVSAQMILGTSSMRSC